MTKVDIKLPENIDEVIDIGISNAVKEKRKRKTRKIKKVFGAVAAGVIITTGIGVANPALASKIPIIGGIFESLQDKAVFKGDYTKYATKVDKSVTDSGVTVTLSEYVCDGKSLYTTYKVVSEKPFKYWKYNYDPALDKNISKEEADKTIVRQLSDGGTTKLSFTNEIGGEGGLAGFVGEYLDEHTFVGVQKYGLQNLKNVPDSFTYEANITELSSGGWRQNDKNQVFKGNWNFKIPIKVDKSLVEEIEVNDEKGQFGLSKIAITPFEIIIDYIDKDSMKRKANDIVWIRVKDEKGKEFEQTYRMGYDKNGEITAVLKRNERSPKKIKFEIYREVINKSSVKDEVLYSKEVKIK